MLRDPPARRLALRCHSEFGRLDSKRINDSFGRCARAVGAAVRVRHRAGLLQQGAEGTDEVRHHAVGGTGEEEVMRSPAFPGDQVFDVPPGVRSGDVVLVGDDEAAEVVLALPVRAAP